MQSSWNLYRRLLYIQSWRIHIRLILTAFFIFVLLLLLLAYINTGSLAMMNNFKGIMREGKLIFLGIAVAVYYVYFLTRYFDRIYKDNLLAIQRYVYELLMVIAGGFLINYLFHFLFIKWVVVPETDVQALNNKLNNLLMVNQTMMVILYGVIAAFKTLSNIKEKAKEIARIQKELLQSQFEALKNQLNPHFLFNSLSILTSLVHIDANRAELFIDKLSKTYRYLLDQRKKEAVTLKEELNFLHNFSFLLQQRYEKKIQFHIHTDEDQQKVYLLPHSFLIILEYIIATQSMSVTKPLMIEIAQKNNYLFIRHNLSPKDTANVPLQTQWHELQKNYGLLGKKATVETDLFTQIVTYKIALFTTHD